LRVSPAPPAYYNFFQRSNIVRIAARFVIGDGLVETGFARRLGDWLIAKGGRSQIRLVENAPALRHARRAAESIGLKPTTLFANAGLDANWFDKHGAPTVSIGSGQYQIHTVNEYVDLAEFASGCRLAVALAAPEG
jgi:acetylornithine deacetylase/succinyl-diaminopimelate desuccinylase-like protein